LHFLIELRSLLFNQEAKLRNISISKALELLFDLNIGMLPYIPIPLIISLGIMARDIVLKRKFSLSLQLFLVMLPMMVLCSSTNLWNHGTCGPNRYVIWMLPLVFYIVISEVQSIPLQTLNRRIYLSLLWIAIAIQGFIVVYGGGFIPHETYIHHTPLARFVLNHFPALYNPTTEIFIKRTRRRDELYDGIVVYYYNNKCRKALVKGKEEKQLIDLCGYIPKRYINRFRNKENEERRIYINY
jgi:hypothetical protein